ncbi:leukocyte elastase inhibitor-like [Suncus etruscus]|uniref:leukocyte elastase inhibitor-like n=1 Tax=Suncus etruscus TaxID=109475 RepID=UPI002110746F|nr:leukocyte elastase inhibitor-like [Suncus etruscus]
MESLTASNTAFALELFRALSHEEPTANLLISPFSMSLALAMVFLGTRGSTKEQMAKTLHFDTVKEVHSRFQSLISDINKHGALHILKVANRLYGEKTYKFFPEFLDSIQKMYGAELASVDFQNASEEARQTINEWVKGQTEGKIPELLTEAVVDSMAKLLLVNAIYFKGKWKQTFPVQDSHEAPFRVNKKEIRKVIMMHQKNKFPVGYNKDLKFSTLELPYQGIAFSMFILLPDEDKDLTTGLQEIEKHIHLENLKEWMKPENMPVKFVNVYLPRFKLKEKYTLNSHLAHMGLAQLFDPSQADLSGMSGDRDLFISKIVHKSFVEVDEEGTEMDVTPVNNVLLCMQEPVVDFKADHPFIFYILDKSSHNILFLGKVARP